MNTNDAQHDHVDHAARAMDPDAFADRKPQRPPAELQWAARRKIATDHAEALDADGLLRRPTDPEVHVEATGTGRTCVVKVSGQTIFDGVGREALIRTKSAAEHDAEVAARAWDEGHTAGVRNASAEFDGPVQDNPYKREGGAS